jgi:hypothetical protein
LTRCPSGYLSLDVLIHDVQVPAGAAALLAVLLHRAGHLYLSERVGRAIDTDMRGLRLSANDRAAILATLARSHVPPLEPLRDRLLGGDVRAIAGPTGDSVR